MSTDKTISKQMSFWLRHRPDDAGLTLTESGWTDVSALLEALHRKGLVCDIERLHAVIAENDKQRFELSADGRSIRARQGHSLQIELGLIPVTPPESLFHGTAERFLPSILSEGLKPMKRHHVHLSADRETATRVGRRHGKPVVLLVNSGEMALNGYTFYRTDNSVWLTDWVPVTFLSEQSRNV